MKYIKHVPKFKDMIIWLFVSLVLIGIILFSKSLFA